MSKTVHIVQSMAPGGIETLVLDLTRHSDDAIVFSLDGTVEGLTRNWPSLGVQCRRFEAFNRRPGVEPSLVLRLAKSLRNIRPQAVVAHHIGPLLYGGAAARLARVPKLIYVEHDAWHYKELRRRLLAQACGRTLHPARVAVSSEVAAKVRQLFPGENVTVIPPGIDVARFRPGTRAEARMGLGLDAEAKVVGTIGRLVPVKAQDVLIRAVKELPDITLVIVGDGSERGHLERTAQQEGVAERVRFLGHRDDIEALLPAFDVFCLTSLSEGLPRSILEAQACGVPVVASDVGAVKSAVCPRSGRVVPAGDAGALVAALREVMAQPRDEDLPRAFVKDAYSLTRTQEAYASIIEGL